MANILVKQLVEAQLIGAAILYEAPDMTVTVVQSANLFNDTASPVSVRVFVTAKGASPVSDNCFLEVVVGSKKSYPCPELIGQRITPGHQIKATGTGVSIAVGGTELTGQ